MNQWVMMVKEYITDKKWAALFLAGILGLLAVLIIYMLGTLDLEAFEDIFALFPEGFFDLFGEISDLTNPYGFLCVEVFSFIWLYSGIYLVYSASLLLPQEIEHKTIELSLSKPITRNTFLGGKIASLYVFTMGMMALAFLFISVGIASSPTFVDVGLYWDRLWGIYIVIVLFLGALSMIAFFGSTIFLNSKKAMIMGIVAIFLMFFIDGFYSYMEELENLKYFTVFFYYNPVEYLVRGDGIVFLRDIVVLMWINMVLVIGSLIVFNKQDIPN